MPRTARERVRAQMVTEIKDVARRHLARDGAAALSLRAISRDLGMVSSAIYRYFPSRDDLLTALIIDSYHAIGEAAERADSTAGQDDHAGRWLALCRAIRAWAIENPHEYALLYGSPVPGYRAPSDTIPAATRVAAVLAGIVRDTVAAGAVPSPAGAVQSPEAGEPSPAQLPASLAADASRLAETMMHGADPELVARSLLAWMAIFGAISFELFGHLNNVVSDYGDAFDYQVRQLGHYVGLGRR